MPVHLVQHPVAQDVLLRLRDRTTDASEFRRLTYRISLLLVMEATRVLPVRAARVQTPLEPADGHAVAADIVIVPVLRAGLGMAEAALDLLPSARVGHVGLQRDEHTAIASQYYSKLPPNIAGSTAIIVDPMLATGGSAVAAIQVLRAAGVSDIRLACIISAPEGIAAVEAAHPTVPIVTTGVDRGLNERKFIMPGLGDFGDRLYGTT